jgi:hypothetical protein
MLIDWRRERKQGERERERWRGSGKAIVIAEPPNRVAVED